LIRTGRYDNSVNIIVAIIPVFFTINKIKISIIIVLSNQY